MGPLSFLAAEIGGGATEPSAELRRLFHELNNQLGIALAHAELLEKKAVDHPARARATQLVSSVLHAIGAAKEIRIGLTLPR